MKKKRIFATTFAALIMSSVFSGISVFAAPSINAQCAVVLNADTGEILYGKNEHDRHYPASCTKIMTALLACEYGITDDVYTMSYNSIWGFDRDSSHIALDVDEEISFRQLMYGMLVASGNECAMMVSEIVGGTTEAFAEKMNEKAKQLGANDSNFVNPHGLFDENHYTTAYDIGKIMCEAVKYTDFVDIISTQQYSIPPTNKQSETRVFNNTNNMLAGRQYYYPSVVGGKTGWIPQSGNNLVTYSEQNGIRLIIAILGDTSSANACKDTANLLDYFFDNYAVNKLSVNDYLEAEEFIVALDAVGDVNTYSDETVNILYEKETEPKDVKCTVIPDNTVTLPISKGQRVATVTFSSEGKSLGKANLYSVDDIYVRTDKEITDNIPVDKQVDSIIGKENKGFFGKLLIVVGYILLFLFILFVIFVIFILYLRRRNIKNMKRRRASAKRHSATAKKRITNETPYDRKR